jgi:hypothetical protein
MELFVAIERSTSFDIDIGHGFVLIGLSQPQYLLIIIGNGFELRIVQSRIILVSLLIKFLALEWELSMYQSAVQLSCLNDMPGHASAIRVRPRLMRLERMTVMGEQ